MNTDVEIVAIDWRRPGLLVAAEQTFHDVEARCSRFIEDSELTRLNARSGESCAVSPELAVVLLQAIHYHRITDGAFDPAILPDLEAAGYDRSFELIAASGEAPTRRTVSRHASISELHVDSKQGTVAAPTGLRIDLGGIGKGYAVDAAARILAPVGDFLINAGGDIVARGGGPDGDGWPVAVTDPADDSRELTVIALTDQAIATSTVARRRWKRGNAWLTHIIDPRTGAPVDNDVVSVTVIAPTATEADVFAKSALLMGKDDGARFLERQGASGLFVLGDGTLRPTTAWPGTGRGVPGKD